MTNNESKSFFEPIITLLGIISSLAVSLSPLFSQTKIDVFFVDKELVVPSSIISFLLSSVAIWIGITQPYLRMPYVQNEPIRSIFEFVNNIIAQITYLGFSIVAVLIWLFNHFISIYQSGNAEFANSQSNTYIIFFVFISYLFALLYQQSRQNYEYERKRNGRPQQVRNLLENHGLVTNNFILKTIMQLPQNPMLRLVHVGIEAQKEKNLFVIVNSDAKELVREITQEEFEQIIYPQKQG